MKAKIPDFSDVLGQLDRGKVRTQLTQALADTAKAVSEHGEKGEVVLKLVITQDEETQHLLVKPQIKTTIPRELLGATVFLPSESGALVPVQTSFEFDKQKVSH